MLLYINLMVTKQSKNHSRFTKESKDNAAKVIKSSRRKEERGRKTQQRHGNKYILSITASNVCVSCLVVSDSVTPWTVAHQAPLSMGFSRQEYWSGLPFPSPASNVNVLNSLIKRHIVAKWIK